MNPAIKRFLQIPLILVMLLLPVAAWIWCGEGGVLRLCRTGVEREDCFERIGKLEAQNKALEEEIKRFRTDMQYVESVARKELNLIRENEIIYRFDKNPAKPLD